MQWQTAVLLESFTLSCADFWCLVQFSFLVASYLQYLHGYLTLSSCFIAAMFAGIFDFFVHWPLVFFNPISLPPRGRGGIWFPPLEIKEVVVLGPMLLKVILKSIKVMITCKILGPYLKNSTRYIDLKNLSFWDFVLPWLTEIVITCSIFEID